MPNLIGKSAYIEQTLLYKADGILRRLKAREPIPVRERRLLLTGPPGTGKTTLGWLLAAALVERPPTLDEFHHISLEHRNGTGVSVDVVRDWAEQACYRPMFGEVCVKFIDEVDSIPPTALVHVRTYLDTLANHRVFIATTNRSIDTLPEQLQSRFQVFEFAPVPAELIAQHLVAKFQLEYSVAKQMGLDAAGNVRAAEEAAQTDVDVRAAMNWVQVTDAAKAAANAHLVAATRAQDHILQAHSALAA